MSILARAALALVIAASVAGTGCGGIAAPDLFVVQRSGSSGSGSGGGAGARLTLLVNEEGGVRCNGAPVARKLSDPALVEARAIQEDLQDLASKHTTLPPGPKSVFSYFVREESGWVRFSDDSPGQPSVLHHLQLFVLRAAQGVCHLPE